MKKLKLLITTLCVIATLAIVTPMAAYADDGGPQGTKNSAPKPPPPPPPTMEQIIWALLSVL